MGIQTVSSDVLVIGGAGAAVLSAVSAARKGASVVMASKGKVGRSGNTIMIGGSFGIDGPSAAKYCSQPEANPDYTAEVLYKKLVASGFQLGNQKLQRQFVDDGPLAVAELLKWVDGAGQIFRFMKKASRWRTSGAAFGKALHYGLAENGAVNVLEDVIVARLLKSGDTVCGALGYDVYTGAPIQLLAKTVVIATGGWQPFSLQNSISDMTGDGIAMALAAGAEAVDLEFLLFIGTIIEPKYAAGSLLPYLLSIPAMFPLRARMTDLDGEELKFPDDDRFKTNAAANKVNKLLMAYFYGKGMYEKWDRYGNQFYYDYSASSDEVLRAAFRRFYAGQKDWNRQDHYHLIDRQRLADDIIANGKRLLVGFGNEYSMGGIRIDARFSAGVPGLYAAGEVTGGLFGAFRSGDGLTEMLAHGLRAGEYAAADAAGRGQLQPENLQEALAWLEAPLNDSGTLAPTDARARLMAACDEGFNFWRDGRRLQKAYDEVRALRRELGALTAGTERVYNLEWAEAVAVQNLAILAEAGIHNALERKESRGCHLRADYPAVDNDNFLFNFVTRLRDGEILYDRRAPEPGELALTGGIYPDVAEYIAKTILEEN
jgi:succinate dehydrogenase / fumarate reductase flavoprotein subunit